MSNITVALKLVLDTKCLVFDSNNLIFETICSIPVSSHVVVSALALVIKASNVIFCSSKDWGWLDVFQRWWWEWSPSQNQWFGFRSQDSSSWSCQTIIK